MRQISSGLKPRICLPLLLLCVGCPEKGEERKTELAKSEAPIAGTVTALKAGRIPEQKGRVVDSPALPPLSPPGDLTFDVRNESLWVHSPTLSTSLGIRAHVFKKTAVIGSKITLDYEDQISCKQNLTVVEDVSYFQARLENTRAFRLYRGGNFAAAAQGFKRALTLDEDYDKAQANYIAALARAGDLETAKIAFVRALKRDPITTYEKLLADNDFEPLRATFRTTKPVEPALRLTDKDIPSYSGYSKEHGLVAILRKEVSWGAENWTAELHVFDAGARKLVSEHTLVRWQDTNEDGSRKPAAKKEVDARLARFNEALTAMKFQGLAKDRRADFNQLAPAKGAVEAHFSAFGQSIVAEKDTLRVVRQNEVLDTLHSSLKDARPSAVYAVPELRSLIYLGAYEVAEGCDSGPGTLLEVLSTDRLGRAAK